MKRLNPRINDEIYDKIEKEAEKRGITMSNLVKEIVEDFYKSKKINRYAFLDEYPCILRDYLGEEEAPVGKNYGEGWYCMKKVPALMKLGSGIESAAEKMCKVCHAKINLEERWKERITIPLEEYTYCIEGGRVDNKTKRIQCRETDYQGKRIWHDMDKCFTYFKGGRCPSLKTLPKRPVKRTRVRRR